MRLKIPKNTFNLSWTSHCVQKMQYYGLSESRVRGILNRPKRIEQGIVEGTIAKMRPSGTKKNPTETWIMVQEYKSKGRVKTRMISAWRYPGVTKPRDPVPVPEEIRIELENLIV